MPNKNHSFRIGAYRPIYLWGGTGTIRMNRLKFMNQPVDEAAHHEVHSPSGAQTVLGTLHCNWAHLMYDWGFPPEVEQEDWDDFAKAASVYHHRGSKVFAYIQSSNCVFDGSFRDRDWYARNHRGRKVYYYSGRYMACWLQPEWLQHLRDLIRGAIERGADGIFFDNMWYGEMPLSLFDAWLGSAGCHCERCQKAYRQHSGNSIPTTIQPGDPVLEDYLHWRSQQVSELISGMADFARELQPGTPISANDYDIIMRATYLVYGQDPRALAKVKEITMVEDFALPSWSGWTQPRLANNALTIRNSLALIGDAHLSVLSYDVGIGFDPPYQPRRYQQGIGEAAACGASMTTKGTEYFHGGRHTTISPQEFAPVQQAIGQYNRWLEKNANLYEGRQNTAPVGLWYPSEKLWLNWHRLAPIYLGACQALLVEGIPWRVVTSLDELDGLRALLVFAVGAWDGKPLPLELSLIRVTDLPGWAPKPDSLVARNATLRSLVGTVAYGLLNAYMGSQISRKLFDGLGLPKLITQTPHFNLPNQHRCASLLAALPDGIYPRTSASEPVLIEIWAGNGSLQVHLLNYAASSQDVKLVFEQPVHAQALSPDEVDNKIYVGNELIVKVDVYKIILIATEQQTTPAS